MLEQLVLGSSEVGAWA